MEAVVEAGARILSREGWTGFTTNKVAEAAGVSVGSLYQYFPDKISLVDAIRRRHLDDSLAAVRDAHVEGQTPVEFVETLVDRIIAAHSIHPGLHRVLLDEAPGLDAYRDRNSLIEAEYLSYYTAAASAFRSKRSAASDATIGLIVSDAIDGVVHNAARRGSLRDPQIRSELVKMIRSYLAAD